MAYWLFKSEPGSWSWTQHKAKGKDGEEWTGVRNYQSRNSMRAMKVGDKGFFYHSGGDKAVVGIVEVVKAAHRDSTAKEGDWDCVDIRALMDVTQPVTLDAIKAERRLKEMVLVKNSRLSVQPVTAEEWKIVCELGGVKLLPRLT
jgi:predicted RNA-binding protein with PUA-like domain